MRRRAAPQGEAYLLCPSPIGWLGIVAGPRGLVEIFIREEQAVVRRYLVERYPAARPTRQGVCAEAAAQLADFFARRRHSFDLPYDLSGLSAFSQDVLRALCQVPAGSTVTYGELARRTGRPGAARAVGGAMAGNPLAIVIPCHRVVGTGDQLVGYSGGRGVATKQWLLAFERQSGD